MALRTARFRLGGRPDRQHVWQTGRLAGLSLPIALGIALGSALGGCSPIAAWRSLNGIDKNDPDPQTALFTHNLAAAEAAPYPNLASVPPPPILATTTAERQRLTQSLIADRQTTAADAGSPAAIIGSATIGSASGAPPRGQTATASTQSGRRKMDEPPEPGPRDSNLKMPEMPPLPAPEAVRPPPPPPVLPAIPSLAAEPAPVAIGSAMPLPPPPVPDMAPPAPPSAPVKDTLDRPPSATTVATLTLAGASTGPNTDEQAQIERVAALYKKKPGSVRVIAYAATPAPGSEPLASYRAALDRAQAVAKSLAASGVPATKIQTEATPAVGVLQTGRVEIQFTR